MHHNSQRGTKTSAPGYRPSDTDSDTINEVMKTVTNKDTTDNSPFWTRFCVNFKISLFVRCGWVISLIIIIILVLYEYVRAASINLQCE